MTGEGMDKGYEKQKQKGKVSQSVCETESFFFFLVPAKMFWVTWQCPVNPEQLSTSGGVDTTAAGCWGHLGPWGWMR